MPKEYGAIEYRETLVADPRDRCFVSLSSVDGVQRPWLYFVEHVSNIDEDGVNYPQYFEIEVCTLNDDEFVDNLLSDDDDPTFLRLKGRFAHFRFGRCKNHVVVTSEQRGARTLYFPRGFADDRIDWIAANCTGAWSMCTIQPEDRRFALEFSFSSERDAVLFKTWWL